MKKFLKYLVVAGGIAIAAIGVNSTGIPEALAQATTTTTVALSDTELSLSTIRESVITILITILGTLSTWIAVTVRAYFATRYDLNKTTLDEKAQAAYDLAAKRAIAYAESVLKEKVPDKINVGSPFVKTAAEYLMEFWPEMVEKLGMSKEDIEKTIISRLPSPTAKEADDLAFAKASTPVTPA